MTDTLVSRLKESLTEKEIEYINHLRLIFQSCNTNFTQGFNSTYIPLGLVIVYMVKIEDTIKRTIDEELYIELLIKEYIKTGLLMRELILNESLIVLDPRNKLPYPDGTIINLVKMLARIFHSQAKKRRW